MQHPDEGTVHAWLDSALAPAEARSFEEHIASCADCAGAVADARGVLAAASHILSALDNVPAGVLPAAADADDFGKGAAARTTPPRVRFRAARWRAAAAVVMVAGASWLVLHQRPHKDDVITLSDGPPPIAQDAASNAAVAESRSSPVTPEVTKSEPARKTAARKATGGVAGNSAGAALRGAAAAPAMADRLERRRQEAPAATDLAARQDIAQSADVSRPNVGSILAADSARLVVGGLASETAIAEERSPVLSKRVRERAIASSAPASAAAPTAAPQMARLLDATSVADRAAGCYGIERAAWTPRDRPDTSPVALLPARLELRRTLGVSGDEQGNRLARPAPGEPALRPGVVGFWQPLGPDKVRVTFADGTGWVVLTLVVTPESVRGPARAWSASTGRLQSAEVVGRRTACHPEP